MAAPSPPKRTEIVPFRAEHLDVVARFSAQVWQRPRSAAFLRWRYLEHPHHHAYLALRDGQCLAMVDAFRRPYRGGRALGRRLRLLRLVLPARAAPRRPRRARAPAHDAGPGAGDRDGRQRRHARAAAAHALPDPGDGDALRRWCSARERAADALARRTRLPRALGAPRLRARAGRCSRRACGARRAAPASRRRRRCPRRRSRSTRGPAAAAARRSGRRPTSPGSRPARPRTGRYLPLVFRVGEALAGWALLRVHEAPRPQRGAARPARARAGRGALHLDGVGGRACARPRFGPGLLTAGTSCPHLESALRANRFRAIGSAPIHYWSRDGAPLEAPGRVRRALGRRDGASVSRGPLGTTRRRGCGPARGKMPSAGGAPCGEARLRVVALLDGPIVPAWVRQVLLDVAGSEVAELAGVVFLPSEPGSRASATARAFRAYAVARPAPLRAAERSARARGRVGRCSRAVATVAAPSEVASRRRAAAHGAPPPSAWRAAARLGVWSFDHLDSESRGGVPFFWEMARGLPATETCLRAETAAGARVLVRSCRGDGSHLARARPARAALEDARASWRARSATPQRRAGSPTSAAAPQPRPARSARRGALDARPLRGLGRAAGRRGSACAAARRRTCWFVALRPSQGSLVDGPMNGFVPVPMPGDRFYADPFLVPDGEPALAVPRGRRPRDAARA